MKKLLLPVAGLLALASCNQGGASKNVELKTFEDSLSYSIGYSYAEGLRKNASEIQGQLDIDISLDVINAAFNAGLDSTQEVLLTEEDNMDLQQKFQEIAKAKQEEEMEQRAADLKSFEAEQKEKYQINIEEGEKFLAENKTKEGVVELPSGLQYKVIKQGNGAKPGAMDKIKVHYTGRLLNGTVFDSSVERGQPITFDVGGVIAGWTEAVQLMPVGSKYELYIPYQLAYGDRAAGQITPYSTLVFEVELLEIVSAQ